MVFFGDLTQNTISFKLLTFVVDGVNVFQSIRICMIVQLKEQDAPFIISVHCMNHCTNMVVQTFYKLGIVWKIEVMLQSLCVYFSHSLKRLHEFVELANIGETWGQHNLGKIKTHGVSMVFPAKRMLFKCCILVLKMLTLLHKMFKTWKLFVTWR